MAAPYGPPRNFSGTFPCLYHNDGHGHFTDVSPRPASRSWTPPTGLPLAKSLAVARWTRTTTLD